MDGHKVRRWDYPPDYRVPARMPDAVRRVVKAMDEDRTAQSPVPSLARELEARCRDFRKIDALYASDIDDTHPAHTYWPEAYLGVIETADWLRLEAEEAPFHWARQICPGELSRMGRGLPTDRGLSQSFQGLLAVLENRLLRIARASAFETVLYEETHAADHVPQFQSAMCLAAGTAVRDLKEVCDWSREDVPRTLADRHLKMRIIEIEYGPPSLVRLHARHTMNIYSPANLVELRDLMRQQQNRQTRMQPKRLDHKDWSWMHRTPLYQT